MFLDRIHNMRKQRKSLEELQRDLQTIKTADMSKVIGGRVIRKNKWVKGLTGITPQ